MDFVHIMQSGIAYGDASHKYRLEPGDWRNRAGTADLEFHVFNDRQFFLRRKFLGNGPSGGTGDEPQLPLQCQAVYLEDNAIDFIR